MAEKSGGKMGEELRSQDDSSDSENEAEPAKSFHRRMSTNREIKTTKCMKSGYLLKQTSSFQRWKRKYFKLKRKKLYYAKDTKSEIFDEIDLSDLSIAECSTKNFNHSFQIITPFRNLVLCADGRKEMEDWMTAIRSAANRDFYDPNMHHHEMASGHHNWYVCSHARPTYCNVCREALSGVTSHGLSCEVCKFKAHKRCAVRASSNCKWTTLAAIGRDIIEDEDGTISLPHQWIEGNLPVSAKCTVCDKTCGSVLRLQDWRCLWCKAMVHTSCVDQLPKKCILGTHRVSVLPPTAINNLDSDGFWEAMKPPGTSPLLVFINSKSGDNQGVKMLRRFKQLLNPAQVFDLINGGPHMGLRLFQRFDLFRILVCGGDGSIGWVLSEIDKMGLHKQCQVGILPLGTGNDLARVLGWGAAFDDDTQLPHVIEKMEHAQIKMLDRWSIKTYEGSMPMPRKLPHQEDPNIATYEESVTDHLSKILHSDDHGTVISSAKVLCETVKDFVAKVGEANKEDTSEDSISNKCAILNEKLDALLKTLEEESQASTIPPTIEQEPQEDCDVFEDPDEDDIVPEHMTLPQNTKSAIFKPRDALMCRANSLKKAVRQIIEHTEKAVDEQNGLNMDHAARTQSPSRSAMQPSSLAIPEICIPEISTDPIPGTSGSGEGRAAAIRPTEIMITKCDGDDEVEDEPLSPSAVGDDPGLKVLLEVKSPDITPVIGSRSPHVSRSRQISKMSSISKSVSVASGLDSRERSPRKDSMAGFSMLGVPMFPMLPNSIRKILAQEAHTISAFAKKSKHVKNLEKKGYTSGVAGSLAGGSFISKVLLANADALCAAVSPLMQEEVDIDMYEEKCVMNNYFGIGVDAKISLDFHLKREGNPDKCRSRAKNWVWYGVLGSKELVNRSYKNLDQRVQLECDGQRIPLPNLQGLVVLNITSFMAGINFWGGTKENDNFKSPSMDDKILEVVAVFGSAQLGISRVINLQHHRIAQCRSVKITIVGDEGVPVQVDGEAWIQPPGFIRIHHKNRAQMLTRDKVFEEALKTWSEKQKLERPISPRQNLLTDDESAILQSFVEATEALIKSVKMASIYQTAIDQELNHLATQASSFLDRLYPAGKLAQPAIRTQVSDLVSSVRTLYNETQVVLSSRDHSINLRSDLEEKLQHALTQMEVEIRKVHEIGGLPHFYTQEEELHTTMQVGPGPGAEGVSSSTGGAKKKNRFKIMAKLMKSRGHKDRSPGPNVPILEWDVHDVGQWLDSIGMVEYKENFMSNDIRGRELLNLNRQDIKVTTENIPESNNNIPFQRKRNLS